MRGLFLSFPHLSSIVLVELLVLSTHFLWAQRTLPLEKIPIHLLDTPAPFARASEAQTPLHLTYRKLPLTFEQNPGQTDSRMKFFPHYPDDYRLPIDYQCRAVPSHKKRPNSGANCGTKRSTSSATLRASGGRLLSPSARYLVRRFVASGTWSTCAPHPMGWLHHPTNRPTG